MKRVKHRYDDALSGHSWQEMERLLADYYRRQGYQVEHCGTGATQGRYDGGIDLKLRKGDEYILVQCKHWNALQVPHNDVHQLLGIMVNEAATGAVLVSSGEFTLYAKESADKLGHVQLIDGAGLREMLGLPPEPLIHAKEGGAFNDAHPAGSISGRSRSRRKSDAGNNIWLFFSAAALVVFFLLVRALLSATSWTARDQNQASSDAQQMTGIATQNQPLDPRSVPRPDMGEARNKPMFSDEKQPVQPAKPTEAEIRESQRRADEAMKVIEATTPELQ